MTGESPRHPSSFGDVSETEGRIKTLRVHNNSKQTSNAQRCEVKSACTVEGRVQLLWILTCVLIPVFWCEQVDACYGCVVV